jgi:hypothetical protein
MPNASIPPSDFVDSLTDPGLMVDGYPHPVSLRRYLCAVPEHGGNQKAAVLQGALPGLVAGTADAGVLAPLMKSREYDMLFSGQGKPEHFRTVMAAIWRNKDKVKADSRFTKYFFDKIDVPNPLQAMVDDGLFGMDCIGFFGRYLEAAGVYSQYMGGLPRTWLDTFLPITRPYDMDVGCALVWVHARHIAIIDSFEESNWHANPPHAIVNICQASNGAAHGPQTNRRVKLVRANQAAALDIARYNEAIKKRDENGKVIGEVSEKEKEGLRTSLTSTVATGYRNGIFFDVLQGDPAPPVRGAVYVGRLPNLNPTWLMAP